MVRFSIIALCLAIGVIFSARANNPVPPLAAPALVPMAPFTISLSGAPDSQIISNGIARFLAETRKQEWKPLRCQKVGKVFVFTAKRYFGGYVIEQSYFQALVNAEGRVSQISVADPAFIIPDNEVLFDPNSDYKDKSSSPNVSLCWIINDGKPVLTLRKFISSASTGISRYEYISQNGRQLYQVDLARAADSVQIKGNVFYPDPITSLKFHFLPTDSVNIYRAIKEASVWGTHDSATSTLQLRSPGLTVVDVSPPYIRPPSLSIPEAYFSPGTGDFESFNAFFHASNYRESINQLGFHSLTGTTLRIDANALQREDNSYFLVDSIGPLLLFGTGGIPDAQDADVVIHEMTHYLAYNAAGNTAIGRERISIEEGNCDYMAYAYSADTTDFENWKVYNWDGQTATFRGRRVDTAALYPGNIGPNYYRNAQLWIPALVEMDRTIGRKMTRTLLLQTLYMMGPGITMPQAAKIWMAMDSLQNGAAHAIAIAKAFINRKILTPQEAGIEQAPLPEVITIAQVSPQVVRITNYTGPLSYIVFTADGRQITGGQTSTGEIILPAHRAGLHIFQICPSAAECRRAAAILY